jgi:hypothetical protein
MHGCWVKCYVITSQLDHEEVECRVTTFLENLETSGILVIVEEMSGIMIKVREMSRDFTMYGKWAPCE